MAGIYRLKTYTNILWVLQLVSNLAHNSAKYPYFSETYKQNFLVTKRSRYPDSRVSKLIASAYSKHPGPSCTYFPVLGR